MRSHIAHFTLPCLLSPGHTLAVNPKTSQLSHLASKKDGPRLVRVVKLSEVEMRVLLPLLSAYPGFCTYEVMLASYAAEAADELSLARYHHLLGEAGDEVLAPLRQVLETLNKRRGLRALNMRVLGLQDTGYCLSPLVMKQLSLVRPGSTEAARGEGASEKRVKARSAFHLVRV